MDTVYRQWTLRILFGGWSEETLKLIIGFKLLMMPLVLMSMEITTIIQLELIPLVWNTNPGIGFKYYLHTEILNSGSF